MKGIFQPNDKTNYNVSGSNKMHKRVRKNHFIANFNKLSARKGQS